MDMDMRLVDQVILYFSDRFNSIYLIFELSFKVYDLLILIQSFRFRKTCYALTIDCVSLGLRQLILILFNIQIR